MSKSVVRVYHSYYGCETGCCGHIVEVDEKSSFHFTHPHDGELTEEKKREWARSFAEQVIREKWPECIDSIDWDSLQYNVDTY